MIQIKDLTKIYKSKKKQTHRALNKLNITLPNKGLVFVLGKSGSGKSTLLNLIGGLDKITSGKIIVDGNDISNFKEKDFCNYRNTHIGFIFQDYHLIEELSIYENIVLSLHLRREEDKDRVSKALEKVGLEGYEYRLPTELSGGERQRVAIARALIKNPRIILADEPTGNLDPITSTSVLEILKELSKQCLVLIVSHNENDAYKYADRILKLSDGEIIQDNVRNPRIRNELAIEDGTFLLPHDRAITSSEIEHINHQLETKKITKVAKSERKYVPYVDPNEEPENVKILNRNLSLRNTSKLSFTFLKSKIGAIILSSFIASFVVVVLALAASFITFDDGAILISEMEKLDVHTYSMQQLTTEQQRQELNITSNFIVPVTDEVIDDFKNTDYEGEILETYNYVLTIGSSGRAFQTYNTLFYNTVFVRESLGTLVTTEDYLESQLHGEVKWLAKAEVEQPYGVYISDYLADCIIKNNSLYRTKITYPMLVGDYVYSSSKNTYGYINGIYDSGYKTTYKDVIDKFLAGGYKSSTDILKDPEFGKFYSDFYGIYGFLYSFNPNFREDFINSNICMRIPHKVLGFRESNETPERKTSSFRYVMYDKNNTYKLSPNGAAFGYTYYNELFGTEYTTQNLKDFTPRTVTIDSYDFFDLKFEQPIGTITINIEKLINTTTTGYVGADIAKHFANTTLIRDSLVFTSDDHFNQIVDVGEKYNFKTNLIAIEGVSTLTRAVEVFVPIFELVGGILLVATIFILTTFAMKMIRTKMHDIGIMKALGAKNRTIYSIFGLQLFLVSLITCVVSTVGYYLLIDVTNNILLRSFMKISPQAMILDIQFIHFNPYIALVDVILVVVLTIISLVLPILVIRKIEPVKIIKAKE